MGLLDDVTGGVKSAVGGVVNGIFGPQVSVPGLDPAAAAAEAGLTGEAKTAQTQAGDLYGEAQPLMTAFQTGTLTAGQQASLDLETSKAKATIEQQAANSGMSTSSVAASELAQLNLETESLKQSLLNNDFTQALQLIGASNQDLGISSQDLATILGAGVQKQNMGLQAQEANQAQRNNIIGDIGDFGLAAGMFALSGGAAAAAPAAGAVGAVGSTVGAGVTATGVDASAGDLAYAASAV